MRVVCCRYITPHSWWVELNHLSPSYGPGEIPILHTTIVQFIMTDGMGKSRKPSRLGESGGNRTHDFRRVQRRSGPLIYGPDRDGCTLNILSPVPPEILCQFRQRLLRRIPLSHDGNESVA